jgi:regulatory protein
MPTITSVKPQKRKNRVNVYLDDKFGFGLELQTLLKHNLKVKQELSDEKIEKIVKESEFQTVYDKLLKFASLRPRSKKEFDTWLKKHKVHISLHKDLFNRLKHLDFLDDKKFAAWWVQQRQAFRPKSVRALRSELKSKGIDRKIIKEALNNEGVNEYAAAKKILYKKKYRWKKYQGFEKRVKMSNFLARKGYSWDTVKKVISEFDQG